APVYRLRGNLLPLVELGRLLGTGDAREVGEVEVVNLVVLQAGERPFGLVVDGVHDTEDVVVKPLSRLLKGIPVYAGATIRGDGRRAGGRAVPRPDHAAGPGRVPVGDDGGDRRRYAQGRGLCSPGKEHRPGSGPHP